MIGARPPAPKPSASEGAASFSRDRTALDEAIRWLDSHLDLLLPMAESTPFDRDLLQRAGEFAILYRALVGADMNTESIPVWRERLRGYIQSDYLTDMARRSLQTSWAWLMPYLVFKEVHGFNVAEHEVTLDAAAAAGLPHSIETVPYRRMDQHYFLSLRSGRTPDLSKYIGDTFLSWCADLLWVDRDAAYSFTHSLFYANGFGAYIMESDHPAHPKVVDILSSLLPQFARTTDWDVLGELLIIALRTDGVQAALIEEYLELFRSQRAAAGFTPPSGPTSDALASRSDRESIFDACRHTTLVAALLEVAADSHATGSVQWFDLAVPILGRTDRSDAIANRVLEGRNRAVSYLNSEHERGQQVKVPHQVAYSKTDEDPRRPAMSQCDRDVILALASDRPPDSLVDYAVELAECFAREGDLEVVLRLLQSCSGDRSAMSRVAALWRFALNQQRPNGAIGYFAHESRALGSPDLSDIRLWLTHAFVEAADLWLDGNG